MQNIRIQGPRTAAFLLSVGNAGISMDTVTLAAGPALLPGQLLAQNSKSKQYDKYDPASADYKKAVAVLYAPQPERLQAESVAAVTRLAEVHGAQLLGLDDAARASLAGQLIIVR